MADTQGEGASIFRQSAMSRIASADDLDKYIKVTNPSAWAAPSPTSSHGNGWETSKPSDIRVSSRGGTASLSL